MKLTKTSIVNAVAAVLSLAALILAIVGNSISAGNALVDTTYTSVIVAGVAAIALCIVNVVLKNDIVSLVAGLGAIACNMYVVYGIVMERIMMIAGLFSYDAGNVEGMNVFYTVIASAVCVVLACVAEMVAGFMAEKN